MKEYGLTKSERLYLREEIGALFESRRRFVCYPYRVVWSLRRSHSRSLSPSPSG